MDLNSFIMIIIINQVRYNKQNNFIQMESQRTRSIFLNYGLKNNPRKQKKDKLKKQHFSEIIVDKIQFQQSSCCSNKLYLNKRITQQIPSIPKGSDPKQYRKNQKKEYQKKFRMSPYFQRHTRSNSKQIKNEGSKERILKTFMNQKQKINKKVHQFQQNDVYMKILKKGLQQHNNLRKESYSFSTPMKTQKKITQNTTNPTQKIRFDKLLQIRQKTYISNQDFNNNTVYLKQLLSQKQKITSQNYQQLQKIKIIIDPSKYQEINNQQQFKIDYTPIQDNHLIKKHKQKSSHKKQQQKNQKPIQENKLQNIQKNYLFPFIIKNQKNPYKNQQFQKNINNQRHIRNLYPKFNVNKQKIRQNHIQFNQSFNFQKQNIQKQSNIQKFKNDQIYNSHFNKFKDYNKQKQEQGINKQQQQRQIKNQMLHNNKKIIQKEFNLNNINEYRDVTKFKEQFVKKTLHLEKQQQQQIQKKQNQNTKQQNNQNIQISKKQLQTKDFQNNKIQKIKEIRTLNFLKYLKQNQENQNAVNENFKQKTKINRSQSIYVIKQQNQDLFQESKSQKNSQIKLSQQYGNYIDQLKQHSIKIKIQLQKLRQLIKT